MAKKKKPSGLTAEAIGDIRRKLHQKQVEEYLLASDFGKLCEGLIKDYLSAKLNCPSRESMECLYEAAAMRGQLALFDRTWEGIQPATRERTVRNGLKEPSMSEREILLSAEVHEVIAVEYQKCLRKILTATSDPALRQWLEAHQQVLQGIFGAGVFAGDDWRMDRDMKMIEECFKKLREAADG